MEFHYVLTLEDYSAFSINQSRTIPTYKRQQLVFRLSGFALFALFGIWQLVKGGSIVTLLLCLLLAVGWVGIYSAYARWNIRRQYRSYFNYPEHTQKLGPRKMVLKDGGIRLIHEEQEEIVDISTITRLTSDKGHYFLYFGDLAGMPVPYSAFATAEQARKFLAYIRKYAPALGSAEE